MSCDFFFKQKTAYEVRISDWSSDVCSSDLHLRLVEQADVDQILRGDRERDEIADRFVEAVVRAVQIEERLFVIGALVIIVAEFVVDGGEVVGIHLDAHLAADIVLVVDRSAELRVVKDSVSMVRYRG